MNFCAIKDVVIITGLNIFFRAKGCPQWKPQRLKKSVLEKKHFEGLLQVTLINNEIHWYDFTPLAFYPVPT